MATKTNPVLAQIGDEIIELTGDALKEFNQAIADIKASDEAAKIRAEAKAEARLAIAERLGLTADELKILLG